MRKIGGLFVIGSALLACLAGSAPAVAEPIAVEPVAVQAPTARQSDMLTETRKLLTTMQDESDAALLGRAFAACTELLVQDADTYREAQFAAHDVEVALDHLVIAAAAKSHLC